MIPMTCVTNSTEESGPRRLTMTAAWKRAVNEWLRSNKRTPSWLATQVGVAPSTIKRMLEEQSASEHVQAVCDITGLDLPVQGVTDDEMELLEDYRSLSPDDVDLVRSHIRRLSRDK